MIGRNYPHHTALGFSKVGRIVFDAVRLLGVKEISAPLPAATLYAEENPFEQEAQS